MKELLPLVKFYNCNYRPQEQATSWGSSTLHHRCGIDVHQHWHNNGVEPDVWLTSWKRWQAPNKFHNSSIFENFRNGHAQEHLRLWWHLLAAADWNGNGDANSLRLCHYNLQTLWKYSHFSNFQKKLLYYRRYIDDLLGIWLPQKDEPIITWDNFKKQVDNWGNLKWKVEQPSNITTFLDLNISIKDNNISFFTYQKTLNLYLYLPPLSTHPPSCLIELIKGEMQC